MLREGAHPNTSVSCTSLTRYIELFLLFMFHPDKTSKIVNASLTVNNTL